MSKINNQQKRFCEAYLSNGCANAKKAAIEAGYSEKGARQQGYTLLKRPDIQEYINSRKEDIEEKTDITVSKRLNILLDIIDKAREMTPSGTYQNLNAANRAIEIVNSMIGIKDIEEDDDLQGSIVQIGVEDCSLPDEHYEDDEE